MTHICAIHIARGVVRLTLADENTALIPLALWRERRLPEGADYDPRAYAAFMTERAYVHALDAAVKQLSFRPRAKQEVRQHLLSLAYDEPTAERVLDRLAREGYLNDGVFADQWALARTARGLGSRRVAQELRHKGVDAGTIAQTMDTLDEQEQRDNAATLARKLTARTTGKDRRDIQRKVFQALLRRGFEMDIARWAVGAAWDEGQA